MPYLKGRPYAPQGAAWAAAVSGWKAVASDPGCAYDDVVTIRGEDIPRLVTWGINPGQAVGIDGCIPDPSKVTAVDEKASIEEALAYMKLPPGRGDQRHENQRGLSRLLYERAPERFSRGWRSSFGGGALRRA